MSEYLEASTISTCVDTERAGGASPSETDTDRVSVVGACGRVPFICCALGESDLSTPSAYHSLA